MHACSGSRLQVCRCRRTRSRHRASPSEGARRGGALSDTILKLSNYSVVVSCRRKRCSRGEVHRNIVQESKLFLKALEDVSTSVRCAVFHAPELGGTSFVESEGATYEQSGKRGGYIINPDVARLLCAYGGDGATRGKSCRPPGPSDKCIPACIPQYNGHDSINTYDRWCDTSSLDHWCNGKRCALGPADHWCDGRPWRPEQLGDMLERDRLAARAVPGQLTIEC